jgi:hypothetical protein
LPCHTKMHGDFLLSGNVRKLRRKVCASGSTKTGG